jgi:hypothetical protein
MWFAACVIVFIWRVSLTRTGFHFARKRFRRFQWRPVEATERRAEIVEHGREVTVQGSTTAD